MDFRRATRAGQVQAKQLPPEPKPPQSEPQVKIPGFEIIVAEVPDGIDQKEFCRQQFGAQIVERFPLHSLLYSAKIDAYATVAGYCRDEEAPHEVSIVIGHPSLVHDDAAYRASWIPLDPQTLDQFVVVPATLVPGIGWVVDRR